MTEGEEENDREEVKDNLYEVVSQLDTETRKEFFEDLIANFCLSCGEEFGENEEAEQHECAEEDGEDGEDDEEDDEDDEEEDGEESDDEDEEDLDLDEEDD